MENVEDLTGGLMAKRLIQIEVSECCSDCRYYKYLKRMFVEWCNLFEKKLLERKYKKWYKIYPCKECLEATIKE